MAVVEVYEETGMVELVDYAAVDDCGNQVNPMIVEGQVHGGIVQGAAQALWEEAVYDDGNLRNPTLLDYCVPSAAEVPGFKLDHTVTPSPTNPLGAKGIGEAGPIVSTPTMISMIVDALGHRGVTDVAIQAACGSYGGSGPSAATARRRAHYPGWVRLPGAGSAAEAVALLAEHGDDAKLLAAGGHPPLPLMKLRIALAVLIHCTTGEPPHVGVGTAHQSCFVRCC